MLHCNTPLEEHREQGVKPNVGRVHRYPTLVARHPQQPISDVVVHAEDVGVLVMEIVVRLLPVRRGTGVVPFPRGRVDLWIIHPVPLTVHHVVTELHVLDDLRDPEHSGTKQPCRPLAAREEHSATAKFQRPLQSDRVAHVPCVALPALFLDVAADRVELPAQRLNVGVCEV